MKKPVIVLAVIAVIGVLIYSQRATLVGRVMERGLETRMGADAMDELPDGLHLALCGAGGPLPSPVASGPCVLVMAGDKMFVVDAGTNGARNIGRMGYQLGRLDAMFLTHFHSDHIDTLGEFATMRWAGGNNSSPMPVYGPEGVAEVVAGFSGSYAQDFIYRNDHHGDAVTPLSGAGMEARPFPEPALGELTMVYNDSGVTVEALKVDHLPVSPAVGYLFRYKGRSILVSGDTDYSENITQFSKGVDLLVHEALAPNIVMMMNAAAEKIGNAGMAKITLDILDYHASPAEAAQTAKDADVGHLLYYHIVPPLLFPGQEALFLNGAEDIFPDYTVGIDGVQFSLPAGSDAIELTGKGL